MDRPPSVWRVAECGRKLVGALAPVVIAPSPRCGRSRLVTLSTQPNPPRLLPAVPAECEKPTGREGGSGCPRMMPGERHDHSSEKPAAHEGTDPCGTLAYPRVRRS